PCSAGDRAGRRGTRSSVRPPARRSAHEGVGSARGRRAALGGGRPRGVRLRGWALEGLMKKNKGLALVGASGYRCAPHPAGGARNDGPRTDGDLAAGAESPRPRDRSQVGGGRAVTALYSLLIAVHVLSLVFCAGPVLALALVPGGISPPAAQRLAWVANFGL